ncbi:MAG: WhiB family transcriptional regulator [Pseudonocardia sediminis]
MADIRRLPVPVTDIWNWQMRAACRNLDSAVFFHPEKERGPTRVRRERLAKQVCAGCPVREMCRDHALAVREPYGVWGGLSETERTAIHRSAIRSVDGPGDETSDGIPGEPAADSGAMAAVRGPLVR